MLSMYFSKHLEYVTWKLEVLLHYFYLEQYCPFTNISLLSMDSDSSAEAVEKYKKLFLDVMTYLY